MLLLDVVVFKIHDKELARTRLLLNRGVGVMPGSSFGRMFKITTFGESHGGAVGVIVDGVTPGLPLEEKEVLYELFEPTRHRKNVCITIGDENPIVELQDCSIVSVSYRFGEFGGSVGVIGPTRMPYEYVVALVDYIARAVGRVLVQN